MRRFLMFLVVTLVAVAMGVTVYYFVFDDEYIAINTSPRWLNVGDQISLEDLGFEHYKPTSATVVDFNAGGETAMAVVEYDEDSQLYTAKNGGHVTVIITTTHEKYAQFKIDFTVGNGTEDYPFFISTEAELNKIGGNIFSLNKNYQLLNDIYLTKPVVPIGLDKTSISTGEDKGFSGYFDGCDFSIFNLCVASTATINNNNVIINNAGLFSTINSIGIVEKLNVVTGDMNGEFDNMGAIAGVCKGTIDKCLATTAISNNKLDSSNSISTGSVVGKLVSDGDEIAKLYRTSASGTLAGYGNVGGLVGTVEDAWLRACWTSATCTLKTDETSHDNNVGGLVADFVCGVDKSHSIMESYSLANIFTTPSNSLVGIKGALVGKYNGEQSENALMGLYYSNENSSTTSLSAVGNIVDYTLNAFALNRVNFYDDLKVANPLKFYQISDPVSTIYWDTSACWFFKNNAFPEIMHKNTSVESLSIKPNHDGPYIEIYNSTINLDASKTAAEELHDLLESDADGNGKADSKFAIMEDLILGRKEDLENDIEAEYAEFEPIDTFCGVLRANPKTSGGNFGIYNFKITANSDTPNQQLGMFISLEAGASLFNFEINDMIISCDTNGTVAGALCANAIGTDSSKVFIDNIDLKNVKIETSTVDTNENAGNIGGLVGFADKAVVENCDLENLKITTTFSVNENSSTTHDAEMSYGGLVGSAKNSIIKTSNLLGMNLVGFDNVGGFVGFAQSGNSISNCKIATFDGDDEIYSEIKGHYLKLASSDTANAQYLNLGGAVGRLGSSSMLNNCILDEISVLGVGTDVKRSNIFIGGLVGNNYGIIENSRIISSNDDSYVDLTSTGANAIVYMGGVVGVNNRYATVVNKTYAHARVNLTVSGDLVCGEGYGGGIVGKNEGRVDMSYFSGNIGAKNAGGIVGINTGIITRCYVGADKITFEEDDITENQAYASNLNRSIVKGLNVVGLACEMTSGLIENCFIACALQGVEAGTGRLYYDLNWVGGSQKCGFVGLFGGTSDSYGIIRDCISVCSFDGVGNNYLESNSFFFAMTTGGRSTGTLDNCVADKSVAGNALTRTEGTLLLGWTGLFKCTSGSTWHALTTSQMTNDLSHFDSFSGSEWNVISGRYPKLSCFDAE